MVSRNKLDKRSLLRLFNEVSWVIYVEVFRFIRDDIAIAADHFFLWIPHAEDIGGIIADQITYKARGLNFALFDDASASFNSEYALHPKTFRCESSHLTGRLVKCCIATNGDSQFNDLDTADDFGSVVDAGLDQLAASDRLEVD